MKKFTIKDAVISVLEKRKTPLSIGEIYEQIIKENLYSFNSATPQNVLKATIRKNCEGIQTKSASTKKDFKMVGDRYWLNNSHF